MATTFYNYTATYVHPGGTNTWSGQSAGSVPVNYNGVRKYNLTVGRNLNTAWALCTGDIQIGGSTLNCKNYVMNSNVNIAMTAVYKWNRYASVATYAQATSVEVSGTWNKSQGNNLRWNSAVTASGIGIGGWNYGTYPSSVISVPLNTSSGIYTVTSSRSSYNVNVYGLNNMIAIRGWGNSQQTIAFFAQQRIDNYRVTAREYVYMNVHQLTNHGPNANEQFTYFQFYRNSTTGRGYYSTSWTSPGNTTFFAQRYYTSVSYSRGSYQTQVSSTSASAYPANARHSDGYWYTAV